MIECLPQLVQLQGVPPGVFLIGDVEVRFHARFEPMGAALFLSESTTKLSDGSSQLRQFGCCPLQFSLQPVAFPAVGLVRSIVPEDLS